jgi:hypothetical protein
MGCGQSTCPATTGSNSSSSSSSSNSSSSSCNITNCVDCLNSNSSCVWTTGQCLDSCDTIQDVECFVPGKDNVSTCALDNQTRTDRAICAVAAAQKNCTACTTTLVSDGTNTCLWYPADDSGGYCGIIGGCDMNGVCGTTNCSPATPPDNGCGANPSCESCLGNKCVWTIGRCMKTCNVQDVACFEPGDDNKAMCAADTKEKADRAICSVLEDCANCTATPLSGGIDTCLWYPLVVNDTDSRGYCGTGGCDMNGVCGIADCPNGFCQANATCAACLENNCVWTVGSCRVSCAIQDVSCWKPGNDTAATCAAVAKEQADREICASLAGCADCVAASLFGGMGTCQWYPPADNTTTSGYCGIGGCDFNGVCGNATCSDDERSNIVPVSSSLHRPGLSASIVLLWIVAALVATSSPSR